MSGIVIERCTALPDRQALDGILAQYYALAARRMAEIGHPLDPAAPRSALAEFWRDAHGYLPPEGCLVVARSSDGEMVGCGMLKRLDPETGEFKRMFVTDATRGTGTGRALVAACEAAAREMGLRRLVADTLTPNVEMRGLFLKLGFVETDAPMETTTWRDQPMLRPHLQYFVKHL